MNRYNIFKQVHKGLRSMLYETALCLQQTNFVSADEAEDALQRLSQAIDLFDKHANTEDAIVFTCIAQYEPSLVNNFELEHEEDHALGQRMCGLIIAFSHAFSEEDLTGIGEAITQAFIDFMIFNLKHMAKEENLVNRALWRYFTDAELHQLTQKIISSIPPDTMDKFNHRMMRGLSNSEIASWLKEVKNNAPDTVFQSLLQTAGEELTPHRWQQVQETITEGVLIA